METRPLTATVSPPPRVIYVARPRWFYPAAAACWGLIALAALVAALTIYRAHADSRWRYSTPFGAVLDGRTGVVCMIGGDCFRPDLRLMRDPSTGMLTDRLPGS